jgi:GTPase involved in cell partitioning and DNA repair
VGGGGDGGDGGDVLFKLINLNFVLPLFLIFSHFQSDAKIKI